MVPPLSGEAISISDLSGGDSSSESNQRDSTLSASRLRRDSNQSVANSQASSSTTNSSSNNNNNMMMNTIDEYTEATMTSRRIALPDHELVTQAEDVRLHIESLKLTDRTRMKEWQWRKTKRNVSLFLRDPSLSNDKKSITWLLTGRLECYPSEVLHVMRGSTEIAHNVAKERLFQEKFLYGSVVHEVPVRPFTSPSKDRTEQLVQLSVKTVAFVRSNVFSRNEQCCYLEQLYQSPTKDRFSLTYSSIDLRELVADKVAHDRMDELYGVTMYVSVKPIRDTKYASQLLLYFTYDHRMKPTTRDGKERCASAKTIRARISFIIDAVANRLPDLILRRRYALQVLADLGAFPATNSRCLCCNKTLNGLAKKKKRCQLCGHNICEKCWTLQKMDDSSSSGSSNSSSSTSSNGNGEAVRAIIVCQLCVKSVNACDYSQSSTAAATNEAYEPKKPHVKPDCPDTYSHQQIRKDVVDYLESVMHSSSISKRAAAMAVMRQLLDQDVTNQPLARRRGTSNASFLSSSSVSSGGSAVISEYAQAVQRFLSNIDTHPLKRCVLASSETRNYPLYMPEDAYSMIAQVPLPENEPQRLKAVEESRALDLENVEELNILCEMAARELSCAMGCITVINGDEQILLAANSTVSETTKLPRRESFCQHLVMNDKPLLVPNAAVDVRFHNLSLVKDQRIRYYCGFPIHSEDGQVLGSICCLDSQPRELTRSQYSVMDKLARSASEVIQRKGQDIARNTSYMIV